MFPCLVLGVLIEPIQLEFSSIQVCSSSSIKDSSRVWIVEGSNLFRAELELSQTQSNLAWVRLSLDVKLVVWNQVLLLLPPFEINNPLSLLSCAWWERQTRGELLIQRVRARESHLVPIQLDQGPALCPPLHPSPFTSKCLVHPFFSNDPWSQNPSSVMFIDVLALLLR